MCYNFNYYLTFPSTSTKKINCPHRKCLAAAGRRPRRNPWRHRPPPSAVTSWSPDTPRWAAPRSRPPANPDPPRLETGRAELMTSSFLWRQSSRGGWRPCCRAGSCTATTSIRSSRSGSRSGALWFFCVGVLMKRGCGRFSRYI